ncbi:MAG: protein translocase subunit SecD [Candidatus Magasanikbacteria bacterium]
MAQKSRQQRTSGAAVTRGSVRSKLIGIVLLGIFCTLVVVPGYANQGLKWVNKKANLGVPLLPQKGFNLGLDLQGGAHLIYQTKTEQVPAGDVASAVEGVRDVIERRVRGGLGVSEPLVQTTRVGNDYRILVELPGVTDVNQAIKMIGETPILEFKEENKSPERDLTAAEKKAMDLYNAAQQKKASDVLRSILNGTSFETALNQFSEASSSTAQKSGAMGFISRDAYPEIYDWAKTAAVGSVSRTAIKSADGYSIVKKLAEQNGPKRVGAQHILICYKGAESCDTAITYTKEQAKARIEELKKEVTAKNFTDYAKRFSTEPAAATTGGDLGTFTSGQMVKSFEDAIFNVPVGSIVGPVETEFGYHLIYKKSEDAPKEYSVSRIYFGLKQKSDIVPPAESWKFSGLSGKQLKRAEVTQDTQTGQVQVNLQFNDEGTKLFGEITGRNIGKQVAIFLDGEPISIPRVNEAITGGSAVISGSFTILDAKLLAQRLNSGALPVPVELLSQQKVDATLGADSLQKSFKAGIAGLIAVMIFMVAYYRLPGLLSVFSLLLYAVLNLAIFKLMGVTLTLSGIAGFILSIGMAVDANVLVFERLKEELKLGKPLRSAMEESFIRAWPSIRDGHVTTLIGAFVLAWFGGTGFVRGFAIVLGTGVIMSLFTAVTITRTIMRFVLGRFTTGTRLFFLGGKPVSKL